MQLDLSNEQTEHAAVSCRTLWIQTDFSFSVTNFRVCQEFQEATVHERAV